MVSTALGRKWHCDPTLSNLSLIMEIMFACNVLVSKFRLRCIYFESQSVPHGLLSRDICLHANEALPKLAYDGP